MGFRLLTASRDADAAFWDTIWSQLPDSCRDIHFSCNYARVQQTLGQNLFLAALVMPEGAIIQPVVWGMGWKSPYGYGGPISTVRDVTALCNMSGDFISLMRGTANISNTVCQFAYLNPMFASHQMLLVEPATVFPQKEVVIIPLDGFCEALCARRVRRGLKKPVNFFELETNAHNRSLFTVAYLKSMDDKGASESWHFSADYIDAHFELLEPKLFIAESLGSTRMLMVIHDEQTAYAHLLGSSGDGRDLGLDEHLYFHAALAMRDRHRCKFLHLGGGMSKGSDDSLLTFKKGFGPAVLMFSQKEVFNAELYAKMVSVKTEDEVKRYGRRSTSDFFPAYARPFV